MPRSAVVYTAHEFKPGDPSCACEDGHQHPQCAECGSGRDAYIHDPEAHEAGAMLTVVSDEDAAAGAEDHS